MSPSALFCQLGCDLPQHRKLLLRELPARLSVFDTIGIDQGFDSFCLCFGQSVSRERPLMLHTAEGIHRHIEDAGDRAKCLKRRCHGISFIFADSALSNIEHFSELLLRYFPFLA